ncbi:Two component system sensor histidine kinase, hybrid [uncultured Desulfobacterium sp.]|uniref:histidine kinase n=1 Tax=uncultured Desulfobacterium sp. TaxID=201089 RepID=A0A445MUN5_9BACT|nr:Two component system sensor histidine kinase, hybrid [uncultured Desulfobacterium sp.]
MTSTSEILVVDDDTFVYNRVGDSLTERIQGGNALHKQQESLKEEAAMSSTREILIVDDEVALCNSLSDLLTMQGYKVSTANSGKEAEQIMVKHGFDLLLLDMNLPDTNGHQLMEYSKLVIPSALVIIITGNATMDSAISALKRGAYDYIQKPFEFEELSKTVRNALNQKKLKEENDIINEKFRLSEERYKYLVQNSPDIIYTLDENGNFTFVNNAAEHLLGISCDQLIGRHFSTIIHQDDIRRSKYVFNERRTGARSTSGVELKLNIAREKVPPSSDGVTHLTVELKSSGMYKYTENNGAKKYVGTYGVARDISERKRLEAKLHQAQKMEAVGTLAGGIAHDFNNLLMGIQGYASIMLLDLNQGHPHYEKLMSIEQYVQRGADLTKQLLGFARGGKYDVRPINLNDLVSKVARMFGRTRKEIVIKERYQQGLWSVEADAGQIEQVLLNLLVNSSHAMPDGGNLFLGSENVILDAAAIMPFNLMPGPYVKISVTDNGVGMDEATQRRIFEPFFTTKGEMGRGTGLGLASAYGIIKNHSGLIDVESEKGVGSTFRFYLPASEKAVQQEKIEQMQMLTGPETVMLVDDETMVTEVGEEILKALGYSVIVAGSGDEAVRVYQKQADKIDIIVLDMIMPGMSGGETYDCFKKINPNVKVLLSSGYSVDGMAQDILDRGCNMFIQKPFNIKELSKKLRDVLDQPSICSPQV